VVEGEGEVMYFAEFYDFQACGVVACLRFTFGLANKYRADGVKARVAVRFGIGVELLYLG